MDRLFNKAEEYLENARRDFAGKYYDEALSQAHFAIMNAANGLLAAKDILTVGDSEIARLFEENWRGQNAVLDGCWEKSREVYRHFVELVHEGDGVVPREIAEFSIQVASEMVPLARGLVPAPATL
jgi:uncharacterized protein (UPF0332 family)